MWSIVKKIKAAPVILFTGNCEAMALSRFKKSSDLLKKDETLELWNDGVLVSYSQCSAPKYHQDDDAIQGAMP